MENIYNRKTNPDNMTDNSNINDGYDLDGNFIIKDNPYIEDPWTVIESYFKGQHLDRIVRHQIESYNNFVGYQIIKTIEMFNPVHIKSEEDYDQTSGKYSLEMFITIDNFHIYRPQIHENNGAIKLMFPQEARLRNFTYASAMTVDINIKYIIRNGENLDNVKTLYKTIPKIHIGKLPIMLKSNICVLNQYKYVDNQHTGECKYDTGGYFIINGSEKTVLGQERAGENRVYCYNISKNDTKYTWKAEIKSVPDFKCISPKQINMMISSKNNGFGFPLYLQIPRVKQPIPLFIVFRALNVLTDKEICEYILLDITLDKYKPIMENLQASIIDANKHMTYEDAIKYITSFVIYTPINMDKETGALKKRQFTLDVLQNDLFPHCQTIKQKIYFLGYMANKLLKTSFEFIKGDDRDCYVNKRIDLTGTSLNNLFRNYFNKLVKDMEKQVIKEIKCGSWRSKEDYLNIINLTNIYKIIKSNTIENGFKRALSTGDFGIKHTNSNKVGVAQVLNRLTYIATLSHLRRISTPTDKSGKLIPPRKLHSSSWGYLCPAETPEGASVGVVKNISYMAHITIHSNSNSLYDYILPKIINIDHDLTPNFIYDKVKVFINGAWVGIAMNPLELYSEIKEMKCKGIINVYTSVVFDCKLQEIRVCNDSGRITRPLLRVKNHNLLLTRQIINDLKENKLTWDNLLTDCNIKHAVIEYIDPEEHEFSMVATVPKDIITVNNNKINRYTHCEIHPSTIFGIVASCIPYPDHNQSPRNTYQCLDINETVLLSNGDKKKIKNIEIGDKVICFNPDTMDISYTKVINHYIRETDKHLFKIKTITGREIIATIDHKFMTTDGWKEVGEFIENDTLIGIMPTQSSFNVDTSNNEQLLILDETIFRHKFIELGLEMRYINKQIEKLTENGILPLYSNDYRLPIISRIFGFLLSVGSINIYETHTKYVSCSFCFETETDIKLFEDDIEHCGFNKCEYNYSSRSVNGVIHSTFNVTHNGSLPSLLIALGITYGTKTETKRNPLPEWVMSGSNLVKREFISGFQGGDGCKIRWNKNNMEYNYICVETSQQINPDYSDSLLHFMQQCVNILIDFGIECHIQGVENINKDRHKVAYKILDKQHNLINYYDKIGYRYAFTKNVDSFIVIEYLRYKDLCFQSHKLFIENIRKMCDIGMSNTYISNETGISVSNVDDIRRSYNTKREISMYKLKEDTIENWQKNIQIIGGMIFMPVSSIIPMDNRLVSDITVESVNHSFIAGNNFLSSNCAQAKQAMGIYATNFNERMDKTAYVLTYPTRPLVDTRVMNIIKLNENPSGCNITVAIMTHTGYNQEDSLLVNKGSIDRGLLQITITHTEKDEDKQKVNGDEEIRCKPDASKTKGMKFGNYNKVNSKGVVPENTLIENRDIIIAKVTPIKENRNDHTKMIKYEDGSKQYKTVEETFIDRNYIDRNGDGYSFAKVRLRALRKPVIGDKFSSRHGQKGTVGNIIPEEDMPFTADGLRPDIIINPHAIPSRMTIGQLKETLLGEVLVELGLFGDGTSFGELSIEDISRKLLEMGHEAHGNKLLYSGLTGTQIECSVFMGPVFYQRLKHMVNDKQHSRSIGPMVNLTRQPAEGRSRDGGLRFGEMERDCMWENTPITTTNGLSMLIKNMGTCKTEVLGWNETINMMVPSKQSGFLYKGERECVQITFEDGRTNICTPEHPILTSDNQWIKAKELKVCEHKVKSSITYPVADFNEEIKECAGWSLQVGDLLFKTDTLENYIKTLILAKLIGYLITDGHISKNNNRHSSFVFLGHMIDVNSMLSDIKLIASIKQNKFINKNLYRINLPQIITNNIIKLNGILIGKKVNQPATLPSFILDDACPLPIVREFLGGLFGGDGHTCVLGLHRGKRDILSSISFSQTKNKIHLESLTKMMNDIKKLLARFDICQVTIQNYKETSYSKSHTDADGNDESRNYQSTLHLDINELIPFHDKIGFRYCCHKSQRLEAGVSYKRLRNEVVRQHNWLVKKVDEITQFSNSKKENPNKVVPTKQAIEQAVKELIKLEPLVHSYAIPTTHDITDNLIKGTTFGKFTSKHFPTAEQYLAEIGALDWFVDNKDTLCYGINRECIGLPTMNLKIIDIRPAGVHPVYDIEVDNTHSFLANGIVAHNCMVSHGASRFTRGRMYDASDKYQLYVCKKCGLIASYNDKLHIHCCRTCDNRVDFAYVEIPYACKLLFQELTTMNVVPRLITDK
jgi:DNA-directed RNA polymerase beta subunit/intein/homing endonuclease